MRIARAMRILQREEALVAVLPWTATPSKSVHSESRGPMASVLRVVSSTESGAITAGNPCPKTPTQPPPSMEYHSVICLATSRSQAENIVEDLRMSEISDEAISVLLAEDNLPIEHVAPSNDRPLAQLPKRGRLTIPGSGAFEASGAVLDVFNLQNAYNGIAGCLVSLGIPRAEANLYENRLHEGNILIAVHSEDSEEVAYARKILKAGLADEIRLSRERPVPSV
jgi:hypothetical protein